MKKAILINSLSVVLAVIIGLLGWSYTQRLQITSSGVIAFSNEINAATAAAVTYPGNIKTDNDKLDAVYSLLEQIRIEHNQTVTLWLNQLTLASLPKDNIKALGLGRFGQNQYIVDTESNRALLGKIQKYNRITNEKRQPLLEEMNSLRDAIRKRTYDDNTWQYFKGLPSEQLTPILDDLYGDRQVIKLESTKATAAGLDELKAVDATIIDGTWVDPTEDFTTYTEQDTNNDITRTADRITVDTMRLGCDGNVSKTGFTFDDFSHNYAIYTGSGSSTWAAGIQWAMANHAYTDSQMDSANEGMSISDTNYTGSAIRFYIGSYPPGGGSDYYTVSKDTYYYNTVTRSGTSLELITYSDTWGGTEVDSTSITCTNAEYSVMIPVTSVSTSSSYEMSYYVEYLDLAPGGAEADISNTPTTEGLGILDASTIYYAYGSAPSNPVQDGECTFTITNNDSGNAVTIDIKGTDFTGSGNTISLTPGSPSTNECRITAYASGDNPASGVVLTTSDQELIPSIAASGTKKWDFKFEFGTCSDTSAYQKTGTITLTGSLP